ncbi:hypothetical protein BHM03_00009988 [Ensete ventricosum]|nr:hypothetical protein BHM03_00009988 [Ensete ventricosum]
MCLSGTSDNLLHMIQEKIKWADTMSEANKMHRKEIVEKVEEVKKSLKVSLMSMCLTHLVAEVKHFKQADLHLQGHGEIFSEPGGMIDYEEDRARPKR